MNDSTTLLSPEELAAKLNVSKYWVLDAVKSGKIPALRLGHKTLRLDYTQVVLALATQGNGAR